MFCMLVHFSMSLFNSFSIFQVYFCFSKKNGIFIIVTKNLIQKIILWSFKQFQSLFSPKMLEKNVKKNLNNEILFKKKVHEKVLSLIMMGFEPKLSFIKGTFNN